MKPIMFGDITGQTLECRKEFLGKYMNKHLAKKAVVAKQEKRKRDKTRKEKGIKEKPTKGRFIVEENVRFNKNIIIRTCGVDVNMLNLMINSDAAKACFITRKDFFRKAIHLFFYEFTQDPLLFFDKLAAVAMFAEKDDPEEEEMMRKIVEKGELK